MRVKRLYKKQTITVLKCSFKKKLKELREAKDGFGNSKHQILSYGITTDKNGVEKGVIVYSVTNERGYKI